MPFSNKCPAPSSKFEICARRALIRGLTVAKRNGQNYFYHTMFLIGAFVIGTTSTDAKAAIAREAGADEVILYSQKDFVEEVNRITDGKGVNAIYDGIGKTTFQKGMVRRSISVYVMEYVMNLPVRMLASSPVVTAF